MSASKRAKIKRRWNFTKRSKPNYETVLTRYAKDDRSRKTQVNFGGEVSNLVFSPDGSRVAMLINGKVHFLDEKLQTLVSHRVPKKVALEQFLKSGDVLAIPNRGLMTVNAEGNGEPCLIGMQSVGSL